jgi:hypothetical protein
MPMLQRQGLLHVDVEESVAMLLSDFAKRRKFHNAGIGEDDIKCPLCFDGLIKTIEVG